MRLVLFMLLWTPFALTTAAQDDTTPLPRAKGAEWATFRGNNNRDGRVVSRGEFESSARLRTAIDFSSSEAYIALTPAATGSRIRYRAGEKNNDDRLSAIACEWQTATDAYLDLSGGGNLEEVTVTQNIKYARLFRDDDRYYRIEAYDGFGFGNTDTTFVGFRVYEGNSTRLLFERKFSKNVYMQRPHITVADMDNNGEDDIVITSWEGVYVFNNKGDSIAGLGQNAEGWHRLRKRGFAAIADVDANGYKDVIIIGAYPYHVDVIRNEQGVLTFGWTRIFDAHIESAKKISRPVLNSVSDFDGDGSYEILINIYNYNDDGNWSCVLFDATSGDVKAQIRGMFVMSAYSAGSGGYVLFCTATRNQAVPESSELKVVSFRDGRIIERLRIDKGEWITARVANTSPAITTHADGISNLAEEAVLVVDYDVRGRKAFFARTENADGSSTIAAYCIAGDGTVKAGSLAVEIPAGMHGGILRGRKDPDGKVSMLLQVKALGAPAGTIGIRGASAIDMGRFTSVSKKVFIPVVADLDADGRNEILIPDDVGEVVCFGADSGGAMGLRWKVNGRGMRFQYTPLIDYGVAVDDLDHDGYKEVIVSGGDENGATVSAYDHNGELLWKTGFPEISARDITTYEGNVAFFGTARSSERKAKDVIVTVQRVVQHTGRTYCLDGVNGSVIWKLDTLAADHGHGQHAPVVSGAGGNIFSTYDIDGDGSDEVLCGYGNIIFFADDNDGSVEFKSFMRKLFMDKYDYVANGYKTFWVDQMLPVAFSDEGRTALSSFNSLVSGTLNTGGDLLWNTTTLNYSGRYWQCMADLDGSGKLWVVETSVRSSDDTRMIFAYDPVNGRPHETFSMALAGFMPVACDMNGDGRDEIVVANNDGISCVGYKDGSVAVLWKYASPGCGPAVVADADADGLVEVITATQDGRILIIDN